MSSSVSSTVFNHFYDPSCFTRMAYVREDRERSDVYSFSLFGGVKRDLAILGSSFLQRFVVHCLTENDEQEFSRSFSLFVSGSGRFSTRASNEQLVSTRVENAGKSAGRERDAQRERGGRPGGLRGVVAAVRGETTGRSRSQPPAFRFLTPHGRRWLCYRNAASLACSLFLFLSFLLPSSLFSALSLSLHVLGETASCSWPM